MEEEDDRDTGGASALLELSGPGRGRGRQEAVDFSNADWFDSCVDNGEESLEAPELFAFFNRIFDNIHGDTVVRELWQILLTADGWRKYEQVENRMAAPQRVVGVDLDLLTETGFGGAHELASCVAHNPLLCHVNLFSAVLI